MRSVCRQVETVAGSEHEFLAGFGQPHAQGTAHHHTHFSIFVRMDWIYGSGRVGPF
jgi:hypothetical protein